MTARFSTSVIPDGTPITARAGKRRIFLDFFMNASAFLPQGQIGNDAVFHWSYGLDSPACVQASLCFKAERLNILGVSVKRDNRRFIDKHPLPLT